MDPSTPYNNAKAMSLVRSFYREVPDTAAPQTAQLTILYGIAMALGLALQGRDETELAIKLSQWCF
jgi:hypothetical protein